jgi:hypothetical protein
MGNMKTRDISLLCIGWLILASWCSLAFADNELYINQAGDNLSLTVEQKGANNLITGLVTSEAIVLGNDNLLNIQQGYKGNNSLGLSVNGTNNSVLVQQERGWGTYDTDSHGNHAAAVDVSGNYNNVEITQRNNSNSVAGHNSNVRLVNGDNNSVTTLQTGTGGANGHYSSFYTHNGESGNTVDIFQNSDSADHTAYVSVYTDNNTIDINQTGNSPNTTYVLFTSKSTGPIDFTLNQNGGDTYGSPNTSYITQSCYNAGGCAITVTQD